MFLFVLDFGSPLPWLACAGVRFTLLATILVIGIDRAYLASITVIFQLSLLFNINITSVLAYVAGYSLQCSSYLTSILSAW